MNRIRINAKRTITQLDKIIAGLDEAVERGLSQTAFKGAAAAKSKTKGSVAASIGVRQTRDGYDVEARAPHARFVENGRGPVVAKKGHFLRFVVGGRVVFARRVRAVRARPFMRSAVKVMSAAHFVETSLERLVRGS